MGAPSTPMIPFCLVTPTHPPIRIAQAELHEKYKQRILAQPYIHKQGLHPQYYRISLHLDRGLRLSSTLPIRLAAPSVEHKHGDW